MICLLFSIVTLGIMPVVCCWLKILGWSAALGGLLTVSFLKLCVSGCPSEAAASLAFLIAPLLRFLECLGFFEKVTFKTPIYLITKISRMFIPIQEIEITWAEKQASPDAAFLSVHRIRSHGC